MRRRSIARAGLLLPAALALAVPAAAAAPAAAPAPVAPAASSADAVASAPAGYAKAVARPNLKRHLRPSVRNDLLKDSLAEEGDETGGSQDLAALCQTFLGSSGSPYRAPSPDVDVIHGDRRTQAGSGKGCSSAQNETSIAVNPENPKNLVGGANDYRLYNAREGRNDGAGVAYTSMDGGKTWKNIVLPGLTVQSGARGRLQIMDSAGDPAIAFGPNNHVYYANIAFSRLSTAGAVTVNTSKDGGLTWGPPSIVRIDGVAADGTARPTKYFNDKEWIGVDQKSGEVYVTWTRFTFTDADQEEYVASPIVVSSSSDRGRTFSALRNVGPGAGSMQGRITPYAQGSMPQVTNDGTLHVAYEGAVCQTLACDAPNDHDAIIVARYTSRSSGGGYFKNTEIAPDYDFPENPDVGRATLSGEVFRINSYPAFAHDPATDELHIVWADDRNGAYDDSGRSVQTNGNVFLTSSADGAAWTRVRKIGSGQDEVFPAVGAYGGKVAVSYYTRRYDPWDPFALFGPATYGVGLDYAMTTSAGGPVKRLTSQTSDPRIQFTQVGLISNNLLSGVFIGDYTAVAVGRNGVAHPLWTDFRGNPGTTKPNQDAYTRAVPLG